MPTSLRELAASTVGRRLHWAELELGSEESIAAAADALAQRTGQLSLLMNVAGLLHDAEGGPERRIEDLDPEFMRRVFEVNAMGPALIAKHFKPFVQGRHRCVFVNLSARVGSISDNRAGGWYSYRASKAAQNMFTKNLSIELPRRFPQLVVLALHPGTVATELSAPFTARTPPEKLFEAQRAARQLLDICAQAGPADNGRFIAWDGSDIEW
jgi:NAD(P)-dependent dehydrogenase (short-subunit alcohol dehydrogenase family)